MSEAILQAISLQTHRRQLGYSQRTLATALGCSERAIQRLEAGTLPDLPTALKLELLYRTPVQTLFANAFDRVRHTFQPPPAPALETVLPRHSRAVRILAFDPSAKALGIAVLEGSTLLHSTVRYLPNKPLPDRLLSDGIGIVEDLIRRNQPQLIVAPLTTYPGCTRSRHVRTFCWRLRKLSHRQDLRFVECSPEQIRRAFANQTKHDQALIIAEKFPGLRPDVPKARRPWEAQNPRMQQFSAITLAIAAQQYRRLNTTARTESADFRVGGRAH